MPVGRLLPMTLCDAGCTYDGSETAVLPIGRLGRRAHAPKAAPSVQVPERRACGALLQLVTTRRIAYVFLAGVNATVRGYSPTAARAQD